MQIPWPSPALLNQDFCGRGECGSQKSVFLTQNPGDRDDHRSERTIILDTGNGINEGHEMAGGGETWPVLVSKRSIQLEQ